MNLRSALLFYVFLFSINVLFAQTCCSGGIPLSNNIGLPNLEKGSFQIKLHYDYNNLNTLKSGTKNLEDNSRLRITYSILLNLNYSFSDKLALEGLFSWVNQRRQISQFNNDFLDQTSGIGDTVLLLKYAFLNLFGEYSNLNIGLGSKIPTGSSTETNDQGILLNADLQPGSNAWDMIYWIQISKSFNFRPSLNFVTTFTYRNTGTNSDYLDAFNYQFGNEFQASLNFSDQYRLLKTISNSGISIKYRNAKQDLINNVTIENTGGNWIFIAPEFSINLKPKIKILVNADIPIYSNVQGTQLTPSFRLNAGLLILLKPKQKLQI